jgi:prepilin-type N-terminal cleavage/methylation domain-containing protein
VSELRNRASDESGFTLVELLVAAVILVIGVFGLVTSVETSHKLSDVSEHETVASQVADHELDLAQTLPYMSVALSSVPAATAAPADDGTRWNAWLTSAILPHPAPAFSCSSASAGNNDPTLPNDERSIGCIVGCAAINAAIGCPAVGALAAVSTVSVPGGSGLVRKLKVYRYVTWVNDLACGSSCPNPAATGYKGDYKRVTIAVLPVAGSVTDTSGIASNQEINGPNQPIVVSAIRNDPTLGAHNTSTDNLPPCGVEVLRC